MKGSSSSEVEVALSAKELWAVYGSIKLGKLTPELLPTIVTSIEILEGDGGEGTVLKVNFPPATPGPPFHKEKFVKVDDENRVKDVQIIEGGFLAFGFTSFLIRFQILEKEGGASSIIKNTIEYEVGEENAASAACATTAPFDAMAQVIAKYLIEKKASS